MKKLCSILVLATATLAANAGQARTSVSEPVSIVVRFGDLDLDHPDGIARLNARVRAAARAVCDRPNSRGLRQQALGRACAASAVARALAEVNASELTRLASRQQISR
jgi:UrcA family protein